MPMDFTGRLPPSKLSPGTEAAQRTLNNSPLLKTPRLARPASAASLHNSALLDTSPLLDSTHSLATLQWSSKSSCASSKARGPSSPANFDEAIPATEYGRRLEESIAMATRMRAETSRAHAETLASLDATFSPHGQEARTKARAMLSQVTRSTSRLAAALQALESEAVATQRAHAVEVSKEPPNPGLPPRLSPQ